MKKETIILIGGGSHCKSCIEVIESSSNFIIAGILDIPEKVGTSVLGHKIIGCDDDLKTLKQKHDYALITLGQKKSSSLRKKLFKKAKDLGFKLPVIIASTAYVSSYSSIDEGSIIMHQVLVNANVKIGKNNIINSKTLIEHDCSIGNHNHVSTQSVLNGSVVISNNTFIGSGTIIHDYVNLPSNCIIGSNSLIRKNVIESGTYVGNPLIKIK